EARRDDAVLGVERATAALREAMGQGPCSCLQVADDRIPNPQLELCREQIIGLAVNRRGEMAQANSAAEATDLEVEAQGTSPALPVRTFASVVDIHARPIPQGISNEEYRPGAISLEMPVTLAGRRSSRMERARELENRARAVVEKTRNLIALEAEDAF